MRTSEEAVKNAWVLMSAEMAILGVMDDLSKDCMKHYTSRYVVRLWRDLAGVEEKLGEVSRARFILDQVKEFQGTHGTKRRRALATNNIIMNVILCGEYPEEAKDEEELL